MSAQNQLNELLRHIEEESGKGNLTVADAKDEITDLFNDVTELEEQVDQLKSGLLEEVCEPRDCLLPNFSSRF
jgi:hypothetical protein